MEIVKSGSVTPMLTYFLGKDTFEKLLGNNKSLFPASHFPAVHLSLQELIYHRD